MPALGVRMLPGLGWPGRAKRPRPGHSEVAEVRYAALSGGCKTGNLGAANVALLEGGGGSGGSRCSLSLCGRLRGWASGRAESSFLATAAFYVLALGSCLPPSVPPERGLWGAHWLWSRAALTIVGSRPAALRC